MGYAKRVICTEQTVTPLDVFTIINDCKHTGRYECKNNSEYLVDKKYK